MRFISLHTILCNIILPSEGTSCGVVEELILLVPTGFFVITLVPIVDGATEDDSGVESIIRSGVIAFVIAYDDFTFKLRSGGGERINSIKE